MVTSAEHAFKVETVSEGLDTPWSSAFLPDGRMLVTEKPGRLRIVEMGKPPEPVFGVPAVWSIGQGGLLDVAVHPDYATNGWIYLSYTHAGPDASAMTRVDAGAPQATARSSIREIHFPSPPARKCIPPDGNHFGGRLAFDGKGHLFFAIGERGNPKYAQDLGVLPWARSTGSRTTAASPPTTRSLKDNKSLQVDLELRPPQPAGPRNQPRPPARSTTPSTARAAATESTFVQPGRNYGWPVITYGMDYPGTPMAGNEGTAQGRHGAARHPTGCRQSRRAA